MTTQINMLPNYLEDLCETWEPVGSRITCNPPPTDTDQDILVLLTETQWPVFLEELKVNKWAKCVGKQEDLPPLPGPPSDWPNIQAWAAAMDVYEAALDKIESYGSIGDGVSFEAWRLGELNLILTMDEFWFDKFMEASDCCKALNVMDKQERIGIFNKIVPKSKPGIKKPQQQPLWNEPVSSHAPTGGWPDLPPATEATTQWLSSASEAWNGQWTVTSDPVAW